MKKKEMVEILKENNIDTTDYKWSDIQKAYAQLKKVLDIEPAPKMDIDWVEPEILLSPAEKNRKRVAELRAALLPDIKAFIKLMKGKTQIDKDEVKEMYRLFNGYFERHDNPGCGTCQARTFNTLKRLVK